MKITFILIIVFAAILTLTTSCCDEHYTYDRYNNEIKELGMFSAVVTIDNCEYIKSTTADGYIVYSHKGNCRYCQERLRKTIEEILKEKDNK